MYHELRHHIEEVVPLTDDEFSLITSHFTSKKIKKNDFLIYQDERVKNIYFVISGLLKLTYNDSSGKEHILSFAMEDWWETDYYAFYSSSKASMSLQCIENSDLLCITLESYQNLCEALPKIVSFFLKKATSGHIASQQRILSLLSSSAQERYEQLLHRYPSLFQRVPKKNVGFLSGCFKGKA